MIVRTRRRLRIAMAGQRGVPATYGGVERHVEEIGARLVERGHEVIVYCRPKYTAAQLDSYRGMTLRHVRTPAMKHLEAIVHTAGGAAHAMREEVDIVHFHALGPGLVAPMPRLLSRAKVVQTVHGLDHDRAKWGRFASSMLRLGEWSSARVPDATVVVSEALQTHYRKTYGIDTTYICNGVDRYVPDASAGRALAEFGLTNTPFALFVGRLVPEKAPDLLIRAFRRIAGDELRLVIAGGSSFTDSYATELDRLAEGDRRVMLLGNVEKAKLSDLYANASVFVLPSAVEGMPLTLLEAAAHGAPLLASDIPPHVEMMGEQSAGRRLFTQGNQDDLVAKLSTMLAALPVERAGAAAATTQLLERFDWDRAADELSDLYLSLVDGRRRVDVPLARPIPAGLIRAAPPRPALSGVSHFSSRSYSPQSPATTTGHSAAPLPANPRIPQEALPTSPAYDSQLAEPL